MGLKYAARAGGRGRARWAERAEPAHGRGLRWAERRACRGVYWGLRPLAPWGGSSCVLAAFFEERIWRSHFFPLETLRPALRAGVGVFGGRGNVAFGAATSYEARPEGC